MDQPADTIHAARTASTHRHFYARRSHRRLLLWIGFGGVMASIALAILLSQSTIPPDFPFRLRLIVYSWIVLPAALVQITLHIRWLRHRPVLLAIGPEGIFYQPFSPDRIDWQDIVSVSTARAHGHHYVRLAIAETVPMQRWKATSLLARINRGVGRHMIEIHTTLLDRRQDDVLAAIKNRGDAA